jgi:hypothetical protein
MNTTVTPAGNQAGDPELHRVPATAPAVAGGVR